MRAFSHPWAVFPFAFLLAIPAAVAQEPTIDDDKAVTSGRRLVLDRQSEQPTPPAPPLPAARPSIREPIIPTGAVHAVTALAAPGSPSDTTVILQLSAGLSIVSLPVRVQSEKLSDIFPNLPAGSRAWVWDVAGQTFVEGLDNQLALGHACWLYVPVPTLLVVTGRPNLLQQVAVDIEKGWNLIGVPYDTPLLRSQQQVYVDWALTPLNDAVASSKVGSAIYTLDSNGYASVQENDSFQPLHGYWVYASGAELLELRQPALSDVEDLLGMIPWGSVLSFGYGFFMDEMGQSDSAHINQALSKLDDIAKTQAALSSKLDTVLQSIEISKTDLMRAVQDATYVAPVQKALLTYYDQPNENQSLAWFVAQAKKGLAADVTISNGGSGYTSVPTVTFAAAPQGGVTATGTATVKDGAVNGVTITNGGSGYTSPPAVTFAGGGGSGAVGVVVLGASMRTRSDFARLVLKDPRASFIDQFNSINTGIMPTSANNQGIFDNFADYVARTSSQYDLKDRYTAMETYFSTLLGMQIKCATLIMNAYNQLGNDPASTDGFTPKSAAAWKANVFDPAIKAETYRFLQAAENLAVRKLPVPSASTDLPVKVPDYVQVVLGRADASVMAMLNPIYPDLEPPGFRVRVMVNPSADLPSLYSYSVTGSTSDFLHSHQTVLPPFDQWRIAYGDVEYDDWILDPALKPAKFTNFSAFHVTKAWRLTRVILPSTWVTNPWQPLAPTLAPINVTPAGKSPFWGPGVNRGATVTASGSGSTAFGSFTFAMRPSTREVFDTCSWAASQFDRYQPIGVVYTNSCGNSSTASRLAPCDTLDFVACAYQPSEVTLTYWFGYAGPTLEPGTDGVRHGTWKADGTYRTDGGYCKTYFAYELSSEVNPVENTTEDYSPRDGSSETQNYSLDWQPGKMYGFKVTLHGAPSSSGEYVVPACSATWQYKGANITFP